MKKPHEPTLDDLLKLGESALSALLRGAEAVGIELESKRDILVRKLDLVTRDEFDAAFAMIKKARRIQESLDKRLTAIEKNNKKSSPQKRPAKKQKSKKR